MLTNPNMNANNQEPKCEGIGCAFKQGCGRYIRPNGDQQAWASYYAFAGDDCDDFEIVNVNGRTQTDQN